MTAYITVNLPVETQFRRDILTTAVEGGIAYWINDFDIIEVARASDLSVTCVAWYDQDEDEHYSVNDLQILDALQSIVRGDDIKYVRQPFRDHITNAVRNQDCGEIDASDADNILQIAAFGELVFG